MRPQPVTAMTLWRPWDLACLGIRGLWRPWHLARSLRIRWTLIRLPGLSLGWRMCNLAPLFLRIRGSWAGRSGLRLRGRTRDFASRLLHAVAGRSAPRRRLRHFPLLFHPRIGSRPLGSHRAEVRWLLPSGLAEFPSRRHGVLAKRAVLPLSPRTFPPLRPRSFLSASFHALVRCLVVVVALRQTRQRHCQHQASDHNPARHG